MGRFAVELQGLRAATGEFEAADNDGRDGEDASHRKADVEGKESSRGAEDRARNQTGQRGRERVGYRLTDPAPPRLVPKHVGTRESVDRVRASGEGLLGDSRHHRRADEQREDPGYPIGPARQCPDENSKPGGGKQRREGRSFGQHTLPTKPRQMQRPPRLLTQSQHR